MYKFENWTWCRCWLPLLGAIAGDRGGVGVHVGGLDVVPLLAAIAGCHCWAAIAGCHCWLPLLGGIAGDGGRVGAHVGGLDVNPNGWLPLMGAIARCHCWAAIAGCHCWG